MADPTRGPLAEAGRAPRPSRHGSRDPGASSMRRRRGPRRAAALLLTISVVVGTAVAGAGRMSADQFTDQINGKQQQQKQNKSLQDTLRQQIRATQDREAQLRGVIAALDGQIAATGQRIVEGEATLAAIAASLDAEQRRLADVRARLAADKQRLASELVQVYKLETLNTPIDNVLSADTFNDFWQRLIDVRRVSRSEQSVVDTVRQEEGAERAAVASITASKQRQTALVAQLHDEQSSLQSQRSERQAAADELARVEADERQQLADAERAEKELEQQIATLRAEEAAAQAAAARLHSGNGQFIWPEVGPISQGFGCTDVIIEPYAPQCPTRHFHTGLDIADNWGTPIRAADGGIAHLYLSSYGYGDHVIIDHGNGWVSVYGHMSSFAVGDGQTVGRGQLIGYEGSTGNSTGPHLHFEIRLNGDPRNPLQYLS